jgi:hypothetical protein
MGFREVADFLIPSWLTEGEGGLKVLTFTTMIDASIERVKDGLNQRFPTRAGPSGLALIGTDRGIPRGRTEADAHYAERLKRWRWPRGHRTRGTAYALLEQVSEYFGGEQVFCVTRRGRTYSRDPAGVESWEQGPPFDWDTTPALPNWGRFWLVLQPSTSGIAANPDPIGTGEGSIGLSGFSPDDADAIRGLFVGLHPWKPAGVRAEWLMIVLEPITGPPIAPSWGHWSTIDGSGEQVPARFPGWRYVSLSPDVNNTYSGNPANYCTSVKLVDELTASTGDPTKFPLAVLLPSALTYSGDPASWPMNVPLIDDGSAI